MLEEKTKPQKKIKLPGRYMLSEKFLHIGMIVVIAIASLSVIIFGLLVYIDVAYAEKTFPGIWVGDVEVSGVAHDDLLATLEARALEVEQSGIMVYSGETEALIESIVAPKSEIDTAFPLYTYSFQPIVDEITVYGREGNGFENSWKRLRTFFSKAIYEAPVDFEEERFIEIIKEEFSGLETYPTDAQLVSSEAVFTSTEEFSGNIFSYDTYSSSVESQLKQLVSPKVTMSLEFASPDISQDSVESLLPLAQEVYKAAPFTLVWEEYTWDITPEMVATGLQVVSKGKIPSLEFTESGLEPILEHVRVITNIEAQDARFQIIDGKVAEFQDSRDGRAVDVAELQLALSNMIKDKTYKEQIPLVVIVSEPEVTESDAEGLGITELVATGTTNFAGSPTNRRRNIANGVRLISGTLIKPGETFSTVKALSPIEISNGFYSELVIKGDRTIPEVGGGLCQVSTTLFRAALNAGLPIVARKNHSYRVSYYEPPVGMDATIYDPAPDFTFTNDYEDYLLLLGYVDGNNITFELWGTKDGRVVESSTPRLYAITSPGPTKYIETDELDPGEEKCIERAHNGASADFTYTVTYPDGEVKTETFYSKYRAWQAVCLVGV